jgi:hypothetical protein
VVEHPRQLAHARELHLAPPAAHRRRAQRLHQVPRLAAQLLARGGHLRQPLGQRAERLAPAALQLHDLLVVLREPVPDRREQLLDGAPAVREVRLRRRAHLLQLRARELHERLVVAAQRLGAQRLERVLELLLRAPHLLHARRERGLLRAAQRTRDQPGDGCADGQTGDEQGDDDEWIHVGRRGSRGRQYRTGSRRCRRSDRRDLRDLRPLLAVLDDGRRAPSFSAIC